MQYFKSVVNMLFACLVMLLPMPGGMSFGSDPPVEGTLEPFLGKPRFEIQQVFKDQHAPNALVTRNGTVLAIFGYPTDVKVRRSEDGGKNWGREIEIQRGINCGGALVNEANGEILIFVEDHQPPAPLTVHRSKDDGRSWQKMDVVIRKDANGNVPSMHMNEHGITLRHGKHAGRIIRAARHYGKANDRKFWPTHYTTAVYSDDGGKTWNASKPFAAMGTGEAAIAELSDGTLYYNSRCHWNQDKPPKRRRCAWSDDGGESWRDWQIVPILPDGPQDTTYGCFGGLARLPIKNKDILLYSNCDSKGGRKQGTVWASFDGGKSWPLKRLAEKGGFGYSSLDVGRAGTKSEGHIYLFFAGWPHGGGTMVRFNLSWLLAGEKTGDGDLPAWIREAHQRDR